MKVELNARQHHSIGNVVMRLALLGGLALGCAYVFLQLCSSLIKVLK